MVPMSNKVQNSQIPECSHHSWQAVLVACPCKFVCNLVQSCKICSILQNLLLAKLASLQNWHHVQTLARLLCKIGKILAKRLAKLHELARFGKMVAPCKLCTRLPTRSGFSQKIQNMPVTLVNLHCKLTLQT